MTFHTVVLLRKFEVCLLEMEKLARGQVMKIINSLTQDPYFEPGDPEYLVAREGNTVVCRNLDDWEDWALVWRYKYSPALPTQVEKVLVVLHEEPLSLETIKPR